MGTFHNILVTAIVMMKTTMLNVDLMEAIAAKKMHLTFGTNIVMTVNVWILQLVYVVLQTGLKMHSVMMTTTMLDVVLMVETVVESLSTPTTAPNVYVSNNHLLYI